MSVPETGGEKPSQAPYINDSRRPTVQMSAQELLAAQRKLKFRNTLTGLLIGSFALGIYFYTFHAISQETFLDDLEVEAKALRAKAAQASGTET